MRALTVLLALAALPPALPAAVPAAVPAAPSATAPAAAREVRATGEGAASGGALWIGAPPRQPPRRVVTLAPSLTDVVVALGRADRLVGVTRHDDAPEVSGLPRVGGFLDPNPEAVMALEPDLVIWVTDG
ncbi:MAG TPA: helical backbone metal receptor, partial [Anaeromyxobacteraceae bacterium]|nr:helical backbone metal receptor [Anaeromyxobacteraceae bacterium]